MPMLRSTAFAVSLAAAHAGDVLSIEWQECKRNRYSPEVHSTITSVDPTSLELGTSTTIIAKGVMDEAITGGKFTIDIKAAGGMVSLHLGGDLCEQKNFDVLGLAQVDWKGLACPLKAGPIDVVFDVQLPGVLPGYLAKGVVTMKAEADNGDTLTCVEVHLVDAVKEFQNFKSEFGKSYTSEEESVKFDIFRSNLLWMDLENLQNNSYNLSVNGFGDLSSQQFAKLTSLQAPQRQARHRAASWLGSHSYQNESLPEAVDWVREGAVSQHVYEQGACSSWPFAAIAALEGAQHRSSGRLVELSAQQLLDCADSFGNAGCRTGAMDRAFEYAAQAELCTEESYKLTGQQGSCKAACDVAIAKDSVLGYRDVSAGLVKVKFWHVDYTSLAQAQMEDLMSAVAQQPVSAAIEGDLPSFQFYKTGVMSGYCGGLLDHGILVVGYGTTDQGLAYWKIKNSWGTQWGMEGYALLQRGKAATESQVQRGSGECGILKAPTYPVMAGAPALV